MTPPPTDDLERLADALRDHGRCAIVHAVGYPWQAGDATRLARRLGGGVRIAAVAEPDLPPGAIWLSIARTLGAEGADDPRRRVRRAVAEDARRNRTLLIAVAAAEGLPAASLASLVQTAEEDPGVRLLLLDQTEGELAMPLPVGAITLRASAGTPTRDAEDPAPGGPAPERMDAVPATPPGERGQVGPRTFRLVAPAAFAIGVVAGLVWWAAGVRDGGPALTVDRSTVVAAPATRQRSSEPESRTLPDVSTAPGPDEAEAAAPVRAPTGAAPPTTASRPVQGDPPPAPTARPLSAPININAAPWARIEIDGRSIGETPIGELRLPRGVYEVRAVFADGSSRTARLVADGNERFLSFEP